MASAAHGPAIGALHGSRADSGVRSLLVARCVSASGRRLRTDRRSCRRRFSIGCRGGQVLANTTCIAHSVLFTAACTAGVPRLRRRGSPWRCFIRLCTRSMTYGSAACASTGVLERGPSLPPPARVCRPGRTIQPAANRQSRRHLAFRPARLQRDGSDTAPFATLRRLASPAAPTQDGRPFRHPRGSRRLASHGLGAFMRRLAIESREEPSSRFLADSHSRRSRIARAGG